MSGKDVKKNNAPENAAPLKENELENVSGGLWGITIIDNCPQSFNFVKCCFCVLGKCPNLIVNSWNTRMDDSKQEWVQDYVLSCSKGYFHNEHVISNRQIRNY